MNPCSQSGDKSRAVQTLRDCLDATERREASGLRASSAPLFAPATASQVQGFKARNRLRRILIPAFSPTGTIQMAFGRVAQQVQNPTLDTLLRITAVLEIDLEKIITKARKAAAKRE